MFWDNFGQIGSQKLDFPKPFCNSTNAVTTGADNINKVNKNIEGNVIWLSYY